MSSLTIGSLFSGVGGLELGLEWAGLGPVLWQVEKDEYCRRVLAKHWPDVERFDDVKKINGTIKPVDLICGGFPCQDISYAGRGAGIKDGTRSGLWFEFARIIGELRPRFVIVENVPALLARGLDVVLGQLAALGYNAWWDCIPAQAVGAPHRRDRVFVIALRRGWMADAHSHKCDSESGQGRNTCEDRSTEKESRWRGIPHKVRGESTGENDVANSNDSRPQGHEPGSGEYCQQEQPASEAGGIYQTVPHSQRDPIWNESDRPAPGRDNIQGGGETEPRDYGKKESLADSKGELSRHGNARNEPAFWHGPQSGERGSAIRPFEGWSVEPNVGRVAHGVSARVDRLRALGNTVVPQVAQVIGEIVKELALTAPGRAW